MAVGQATSMALQGLDGLPVVVECDLGRGLPGVSIVGLGDAAVVQARDRIRAAMLNTDLQWPKSKVIMSLSPADVRKAGSGYDLAMIASILMAQGGTSVARELLNQSVVVGELGLDGSIRPVVGVVPIVLSAYRQGFRYVVIPRGNAADAAELMTMLGDMVVIPVGDLGEFVSWLGTGHPPTPAGGADGVGGLASEKKGEDADIVEHDRPDLADVIGQYDARRGLEIAAAGGHAVMLTGPPGSGKSMLAERLPTILPPMNTTEKVEAAAIHSIAGPKGNVAAIWAGRRPYVAPHPSVTMAALIGWGGSGGNPLPGAISLAHHGVLFVDEAAETRAGVLDALRIPLETRSVELSRARRTVRFPAQFQLIMAANPCQCGADQPAQCTCTSVTKRRYHTKITGPMRDRIDIFLTTQREPLLATGVGAITTVGESSAVVAQRVAEARQRASHRWRDAGLGEAAVNATIPGRLLRKEWCADEEGMVVLQEYVRSGELSQRGVDRALRVSWTLADLAGDDRPGLMHVLDAADLYADRVDSPLAASGRTGGKSA